MGITTRRTFQSEPLFVPISEAVLKVKNVLGGIGKRVEQYGEDFIAGPKERFGAIEQSIQQKSVQPLKTSFQKQFQEQSALVRSPETGKVVFLIISTLT